MKNNIGKKLFAGAMAMTMMLGTAALTVGAADSSKSVEKTTTANAVLPINGSDSTLDLNKTYKLPTYISKFSGLGYTVSISNNKVLNYKNGELTAVGTGDVTLTITLLDGTQISKNFHVEKPAVSVKLDLSSLNLKVGQSQLIKAVTSQSNAKLLWSSSNTKVATVDQNGKVTAKKSGTAVITAKSSTGKTASCTIKVGSPVAVEKVTLNKSTAILRLGGSSVQLKATVTPTNATNQKVTYTSSNTKVANVSSDGKVTAKSVGTATITAKSANGKTATCKVTVKEPIAVTKVTLSKTSASLKVGGTVQLTTAVAPSNATNKTLTYTTSNSKVATVSSTGKVTAKAAGTVTITVKSANGKTATCKITVTK